MLAASWIGSARLRFLGIDASEASLERRGFPDTAPAKRERLEGAGKAFVEGYRAALVSGDGRSAADRCEELPAAMRGFAFEGAAMGLTLIDLLALSGPRRLAAFIDGPASSHAYMAHVGAGWALARCPWGMSTFYSRLDPLLRSLAVDGLGFHQAYFKPRRYIGQRRSPWRPRLATASFDNGVGRALWFASGAQARRAIGMIERFPRRRQAALWGGLGLAMTYAGAGSEAELADVRQAAGVYRHELMVGAAFAAKARARAGNTTPDTRLGCRVLCRCEPEAAADATDRALRRMPSRRSADSYELWRRLTAVELARLSGDPLPDFKAAEDEAVPLSPLAAMPYQPPTWPGSSHGA